MGNSLFNTLDTNTRLKLLEQMIGFTELPVSIDTFLHDDYFLGESCGYNYDLDYEKTYKVWRDALNELFPDPITMKSSFVCNTGAIGCVTGDTKILIDNEIKTIKDLYDNRDNIIGHCTKSYDLDNDSIINSRINNVWYTGKKKIAKITFDNYSILKCTYDHPLLCCNESYEINFKHAEDLEINDRIKTINGCIIVKSIELTDYIEDVYDLTIDDYSNYTIQLGDESAFSHNTGKSNMAKIAILYTLYKMSCCKDFYAYNRLEPNKKVLVGVSHTLKKTAEKTVDELWAMMDGSPWFREQWSNPESFLSKYIEIRVCKNPDDFVGENMAIWWGTELNDYKPQERAIQLIDSAISRFESRFMRSFDLFNLFIVDSSDRGVDSAVPTFIKNNPYGREAVQFRFSHWEAKPGDYWHKPDKNRIDTYEYLYDSSGKKIHNANIGKPALSFRVYTGDSEIHPCIIRDDLPSNILDKMDPDRFIDVPNELRNSFEANVELALQEKCGKATETTNQYFNPQFVTPAFTIPNKIHYPGSEETQDIICSSFFDEDDTYYQYLTDAIELIPKNTSTFIHIDNGLVDDRLGFCVGYVYDVGRREDDGVISYDPVYKIPIIMGISRLPGEETNMRKLMQLVKWVHTNRPLYCVSSDTFQNVQIKQDCFTLGINYRVISLDRSTTGYKLTKEALYRKKLELCDNKLTKTEMLNVYFDEERNKVDHHEEPNAANEIGSNSKDTLDSLCGCVQSMYEAITEDIDGVMNPKIVSTSAWTEYVNEYTSSLIHANMMRQMRTMFNNRRH